MQKIEQMKVNQNQKKKKKGGGMSFSQDTKLSYHINQNYRNNPFRTKMLKIHTNIHIFVSVIHLNL